MVDPWPARLAAAGTIPRDDPAGYIDGQPVFGEVPTAMSPAGRHFLQIPGPTNTPERVLRAMSGPTIDHRGPAFGQLSLEILAELGAVFGTSQPVVIYPSSGTGAWEAALVNTLNHGDRVLCFETGHFATLWQRARGQARLARRLRTR